MTVVEEVEVKINEAETSIKEAATPLFDVVRRMVLASVGAVALTFDEVEGLVRKLVDRGEIAQKDAEKLLKDVQSRLTGATPATPVIEAVETSVSKVETNFAKVEQRFDASLESLLNRLNIPSKRDIDDLSAKIAQLTVRVEELRKAPAKASKVDNGVVVEK